MSRLKQLRELIRDKLTAAAEEIFTEFQNTILQYEEELDRQRRLLETGKIPHIKAQTAERSQSCFQWEVSDDDHQLCSQERSFKLDQKELNPPQAGRELSLIKEEELKPAEIKEENVELCIIQGEEQLLLKQETEAFMVTVDFDEICHSEPEPNREQFFQNSEAQKPNQDKSILKDPKRSKKKRHKPAGEKSHSSEGRSARSKSKSLVTCEFCSKEFKFESLLKKHRQIHTGEKPYPCKTCGKGFIRKFALLAHMRVHTGEKPYSCKVCNKSFSCSSNLLNHTRVHSGEKPFSCETCGKGFPQKYKLILHMKCHSDEKPFYCEMCHKGFRRSDTLSVHMRTHTGEKLFTCETCGKSFNQNQHLTVHRRTHTGEKPFPCNLCDKRFKQRVTLKNHQKMHTEGKQ